MTNKPREFWVYEGKRNCTSLRFVYTNPQTIKQDAPENWDEFYVIEAAPAIEKIKRLEASLKILQRYHSGDGTVTREDVFNALSILEGR